MWGKSRSLQFPVTSASTSLPGCTWSSAGWRLASAAQSSAPLPASGSNFGTSSTRHRRRCPTSPAPRRTSPARTCWTAAGSSRGTRRSWVATVLCGRWETSRRPRKCSPKSLKRAESFSFVGIHVAQPNLPFLTRNSIPFSGFLLNKLSPMRYFRFLMISEILKFSDALLFFECAWWWWWFVSSSLSTSLRFHSGDAPRSEKLSYWSFSMDTLLSLPDDCTDCKLPLLAKIGIKTDVKWTEFPSRIAYWIVRVRWTSSDSTASRLRWCWTAF